MIFIISGNDICSESMNNSIVEQMSNYGSFVYLTATSSLKRIRQNTLSNLKDVSGSSFFGSISDFERTANKSVYAQKNYLSNADQRYILSCAIESYFADDSAKIRLYKSIRHELFNLYSGMMFRNAALDNEHLDSIAQKYSVTERDIFALYMEFKKKIDSLLESVNLDNKTEIKIFSECKKQMINTFVSNTDAVFMDGFLFFDEIQTYIITCALNLGKPVYIVSKQFSDGTGEFILKDSLRRFKALSEVCYKDSAVFEPKSALDFAKSVYPDVKKAKPSSSFLDDGSIRFIEPFINRDEELRYVVQSISERLRNNYNGTKQSVIDTLSETAIITAISKNTYEQRLADLFSDVGVFILKDLERCKDIASISHENLPEILFSKREFMDAEIKFSDGSSVSFEDKLRLFDKCFDKIKVNRHIRPISSYPIGQFVLRLYDSVIHGMSLESFKCILYSNWRYNLGGTTIKWSDFISDFKHIEIWFEGKQSIDDWMKTADELIIQKEEIDSNPLYLYHPVHFISRESLEFLKGVLSEIESLSGRILSVSGDINSHISVLRDVVMRADDLIAKDSDELEYEQQIIKRLVGVVSDIGSSSVVGNITPQFFAENIRAMLTEYDADTEEDYGDLSIDVVNLENMRMYDVCYFIMCESDHYPRRYDVSFPYTETVCSILSDIDALPTDKFGLDYHIELERYLLKNVLDFTRKQLIVTHTEKEGSSTKSISVFAENIATIFDSDIKFEPRAVLSGDAVEIKEERKQYLLPRKNNYSLTELAVFKLCPRLYYHRRLDKKSAYTTGLQLHFYMEAIMYCDLFCRFMEYNVENKAVYDADKDTYMTVLRELYENVLSDVKGKFSFFSQYEISDAGRIAFDKVVSSIENSKEYLDGEHFTVVTYKNAEYDGNGYTLTIEHDNRFVDYDNKTWRMSQNNTYLEFLVLKTTDRKSKLVHYKDMIEALDDASTDEDRINLTSRIIAKINIQFDSKRFAMDGIRRTDRLVKDICRYDFSNADAMPSNYCNYCRFADVCMSK